MNKEILIIGAGKIGRGFIGQLFFRSGYKLWFVDSSDEVVRLLNKEKRYRVDIAKDEEDETEYVEVEGAYTPKAIVDIQAVANRISLMSTCVGASNIETTAVFLRNILEHRDPEKPLNWLICENAFQPAIKIREILLQGKTLQFREFVTTKLGLVETQVLRTGMNASREVLQKEPLAVRMQDWWSLPFDKDAFIGSVPDVTGFLPKVNFKNELIRKIYTFNGTNGPISYIGWANGYKILHMAAQAFRPFFDEIQEESAHGLTGEFGFNENEQREFMALAMKKYTDPALNDEIERNAKDLCRKLGKEERLVGPALLCQKHGRKPLAYAKAIAAAYCYDGSSDAGTLEVIQTIKEQGIEIALKKYSGLEEENELYQLVLIAYHTRSYILKDEK